MKGTGTEWMRIEFSEQTNISAIFELLASLFVTANCWCSVTGMETNMPCPVVM